MLHASSKARGQLGHLVVPTLHNFAWSCLQERMSHHLRFQMRTVPRGAGLGHGLPLQIGHRGLPPPHRGHFPWNRFRKPTARRIM